MYRMQQYREADVTVVLELHERRDTLTRYCKTLRSLGVESDAVSVAVAAANSEILGDYALILLVPASDDEAPSPLLRPLLARCRGVPGARAWSMRFNTRVSRSGSIAACTRWSARRSTAARSRGRFARCSAWRHRPRSWCNRNRPSHASNAASSNCSRRNPDGRFPAARSSAHIYDDHRVVCPRTVDAHVKNLRRKLSGAPDGAVVRAVYGEGYAFVCDGRVS